MHRQSGQRRDQSTCGGTRRPAQEGAAIRAVGRGRAYRSPLRNTQAAGLRTGAQGEHPGWQETCDEERVTRSRVLGLSTRTPGARWLVVEDEGRPRAVGCQHLPGLFALDARKVLLLRQPPMSPDMATCPVGVGWGSAQSLPLENHRIRETELRPARQEPVSQGEGREGRGSLS